MAKKQFDDEGKEFAQQLQSVSKREIAEYQDIAKEAMREVIYAFYQKRIEFIFKNEVFQKSFEDKILEYLHNDQLSPSQVLSTYKFLMTAGNQATKILLEGIKPGAHASSSLLDELESSDDAETLTEGMQSHQTESLDKIVRILNSKKGSK